VTIPNSLTNPESLEMWLARYLRLYSNLCAFEAVLTLRGLSPIQSFMAQVVFPFIPQIEQIRFGLEQYAVPPAYIPLVAQYSGAFRDGINSPTIIIGPSATQDDGYSIPSQGVTSLDFTDSGGVAASLTTIQSEVNALATGFNGSMGSVSQGDCVLIRIVLGNQFPKVATLPRGVVHVESTLMYAWLDIALRLAGGIQTTAPTYTNIPYLMVGTSPAANTGRVNVPILLHEDAPPLPQLVSYMRPQVAYLMSQDANPEAYPNIYGFMVPEMLSASVGWAYGFGVTPYTTNFNGPSAFRTDNPQQFTNWAYDSVYSMFKWNGVATNNIMAGASDPWTAVLQSGLRRTAVAYVTHGYLVDETLKILKSIWGGARLAAGMSMK